MGSGYTRSIRFAAFFSYSKPAFADMLYFLQVQAGEVTKSAHPARFSPDDKYSSKADISTLASGDEGS